MTSIPLQPIAATGCQTQLSPHLRGVSERIAWIDCAKGMGIILVVYGHVVGGLVDAGIQNRTGLAVKLASVVYTFHMPLFFLLAGLWIRRNATKRFSKALTDRASTVLYPYAIWTVIQYFVNVAASPYTNNGGLDPLEVWRTVYKPYAQFWFLYVLFIDLLFADLVLRCSFGPVLLVAAAFILYITAGWWNGSQWPIGGKVANSLIFVAGGGLFSSWLNSQRSPRPMHFVSSLAAGTFLLTMYLLEGPVNWCLSLAIAAAGVTMVLALSQGIHNTISGKFLQVLGRRSLEIFVMHVMAMASLRIILAKGMQTSLPILHLVIGVAGGLLVPIAAYWLIDKYDIPLFTLKSRFIPVPDYGSSASGSTSAQSI